MAEAKEKILQCLKDCYPHSIYKALDMPLQISLEKCKSKGYFSLDCSQFVGLGDAHDIASRMAREWNHGEYFLHGTETYCLISLVAQQDDKMVNFVKKIGPIERAWDAIFSALGRINE